FSSLVTALSTSLAAIIGFMSGAEPRTIVRSSGKYTSGAPLPGRANNDLPSITISLAPWSLATTSAFEYASRNRTTAPNRGSPPAAGAVKNATASLIFTGSTPISVLPQAVITSKGNQSASGPARITWGWTTAAATASAGM